MTISQSFFFICSILICMKTIKTNILKLFFVALLTSSVLLPGVTQNKTADKLEEFGFRVFPEPVPIPPFSVVSLDGKTVNSKDFKGSVTLLNFWATWCPPCQREMPSIQRLQDSMKGTSFKIVAISTGEKKDTVLKFLKTNPYTFPMYLDEKGKVGASFASQGIPTTYVLDKDGNAIAGISGSREYDDPKLIALFKELSK